MSFEFRPALRENVGVLVGISGPSGSGKTFTALRIATGMAGDKSFALIDTEAGRAKHYADRFKFDHGDLMAPFRPDHYAEAIHAADAAGYPVIVVDSASHCWAGDGGILDWHEEELTRMAGDDWKKREACKMAAWIKPKMSHKQMVNRLLQVRAHLILCFRAEEKIEMSRENGKMEIRKKQGLTALDGWFPICEKNLPYELTASFLLTCDKPGIPKPIKLQEQHRAMFPLDRPIDEQCGVALAAWAKGGVAKPDGQSPDVPLVVRTFTKYADYIARKWPECGGDTFLKAYCTTKNGAAFTGAMIRAFKEPKQIKWLEGVLRRIETDFDLAGMDAPGPIAERADSAPGHFPDEPMV